MEYEVVFTNRFGDWWDSLESDEQDSVDRVVRLLIQLGPGLRHPYSSGIQSSRHSHMRELRIQHGGRPYRVLYAFDPKRRAVLLFGGDKTGADRWYEMYVPVADLLYDRHLEETNNEEESDG